MDNKKTFTGNKKVGASLFGPVEKKLVARFVPKIPLRMETYHLTLFTIPWCIFIILFSALANLNIHWLWGVSLMILLQYITDLFDGAVGRYRQTGLVKWGFYMDHFLDYVFLSAIMIGYSLLMSESKILYQIFLLAIFGSFMVNSFLSFAALGQFRIAYFGIGPTEMRLIFILVNTLIIVFGKTYIDFTLPFILLFSLIGLYVTVYRTQKEIWRVDMEEKKKTKISCKRAKK